MEVKSSQFCCLKTECNGVAITKGAPLPDRYQGSKIVKGEGGDQDDSQ